MNGINTAIGNTGTQTDLVGLVALLLFLVAFYILGSKRKQNKEEMRHHNDKPELWE